MASNKSKVKEKSSQRRPAQPKEAETTQTIVVNPGYAYVNQDIPILAPDHHRNQRAPHGNRNLLTLSADEHAVFSNHDSTANQNGCSKVNSRILSNQNHADIGIVSAPANQIPGSPRKSATLPHGTKSPKSGQKLSSNSFSGGFLSRLKRKFRLKSKNYELSLGNDKNIEGISYQQKPTQDGQLAANSAGKLDQTADHENVAQKKKGNYKPLEYMPEGIPGSKIKGSERLSLVDYPGDHSMEDGHVIDDEGGGNFCMSMDDPGYESLEDVRRKILQQQKVAMVTDDRASDQRQGVRLSHMQRKLFNISSGGYADIGDEILDGDYCDPRDLGHRRTQSSGFPARCTDGMSNQNGFLPNSSTSMYATCRDVETVGCAKSEDSDTHSLECTQTEDNIKFLLPISSNLGASRTKSYPGKAEDAEDNSKEFFSSGHNSDSFLAQCGNTDESELYANPKIVLRKKSQKKQSDNRSSTTTSERSSHNEKSSQDLTCISSSQSGSPEPQQQRLQRQLSEAAPPIPERKYLDVSPTASEMTSFAKDKLYSKLKMETRKKNTGIAEDQLCLAPITPKILKSKAPKENPSACSSECLTERHRGNKVEERSAGRMRTVNKSCITKETMDSSAHRHENLGPRNSDSAFKRDSAAGKLADICSVQKQEKNFFRTPESRKKLLLKSSDLISRHEKVSGRKSDSSLKDDKSTLKTSDSSSRLEKLSTKSSESYARHEKLSPKNSDSSIRQEKMSMKVSENRHEKLSPKNSDTRSDTEDYLGIFTPIVQRDDEICLMCQYTRSLHHAVAETSQVTPTVTPKKPIDFMCSKCFYHKNRCHCYVSEPSHAPFESKPWNKLDGSKANMQTLREGTEEESCNVCQQPQTGVSFCAGDKNISKHCESESTCTSGFSYQDRAIISGDVRLVMIGQGNDQRTSPRNEDESERNSEAEKPRNTDLAFIKDNKIVHTSISATLTPSSKCSHSPQGTQLCLGQVPEHCCKPGQTLSPMDSMFGSSSLIESVESRSALPDIGDLDLDLSHCTSDSGCILDDSLGISRRLEHLVPKETEITEKIIDHRIPNLEQQQTTEHAAMVTNSNNISHSSASTDARLNNTPAVNHLQTSSDSFGGGVTDASGSSPSSIDNGCSRNPTFYEESADQVLESLPYSRSDSFADEYGYGCAADFNPKDRLPTVQERPLSGLKNLNLHMTEEDSDVFPQAKLETSESDSQEERKRKEFEYQDYLQSLKCCHGNNDSETSTQPAEKSAHHRSHGHTKHKKKTKKPRLGTRVRSLNQEIPESKTEKRHFSDAAVGLDSRLPDFYYHDNEPVHMTIDEIGMNSDRNFSYEEPIHMSLDELKLSAAFRSKNKVKVKSKSFDEFSYVDNSVTGATKDDHHGYAEEDEIRNPWEVHPTYSPDANYSNQSNVPFTPSRQHQRHQHHHYHQSQSTCHQAVRPRSMIDTVSTTNHHLNNVYESLDSDQESEHGVYELDPPPPPNEPVQFRRGEVLHSAFRDSRLWTEGMEHDLNFVSGQDDREEMIGSESSPDWPMDEDFMRRLEARPPAVIPRSQSDEGDASQNFMDSMQQLKDCGWYWGPLSWEEAEIKLLNKPDGSFLVRDSSNDRYILSLSFNMAGRVHHTRIEHHKGKFSFWSQPDSHGKSTIKDFIEQCVKNSRNGQFLYFIRPSGPGSPPLPVHLLYPISRHEQMRSLQHMCRFQILQCIRRDHIDQLPIPRRILEYLKDPQYYVEFLEG